MQRIKTSPSMDFWETQIKEKVRQLFPETDPAHDFAHLSRVAKTAKALAIQEDANLYVVLPAAWLHDLINLPKSDPRRNQASRLSSEAAIQLLSELNYPEAFFVEIGHAIQAHSFSANIEPQTLEAKIVQDADRLDALGAIGIARCFSVGGQLQRSFYDPLDPFAKMRPYNDAVFTLDHFFVKLLRIGETLRTHAGQHEGKIRIERIKTFLSDLEKEIG
jgi:uncharacterized protein